MWRVCVRASRGFNRNDPTDVRGRRRRVRSAVGLRWRSARVVRGPTLVFVGTAAADRRRAPGLGRGVLVLLLRRDGHRQRGQVLVHGEQVVNNIDIVYCYEKDRHI